MLWDPFGVRGLVVVPVAFETKGEFCGPSFIFLSVFV